MTFGLFELIILILFIVVFFVPPIRALTSKSASGWYKFIWFLLSGAFSWIGYFAYKLLIIDKSDQPKT